MKPNYLIHFNNSSFKNELFIDLFGNEELFIEKVLQRVAEELNRQFALLSDSYEDLKLSNQFEIKTFKNRLYYEEIENILINNRPDILIITTPKVTPSNLSELASACNTRLITLALPSFTNYKFFQTKLSLQNEENKNFHEGSQLEYILREIWIGTAAGLLLEIIKSVFSSI